MDKYTKDHPKLLKAYDTLIQSLLILKDQLEIDASNHYPIWIPTTETEAQLHINNWDKAISLFLAIFFTNDQEKKETLSCHGLIGCSTESIVLANKVNQAKDQFKAEIAKIKSTKPSVIIPISEALPLRNPAIQNALSYQSLNRLHLKQCYRHIPVSDQYPNRVGFTWSLSGRSITKISTKAAEKQLLALGSEKIHIQAQLSQLYALNHQTAKRLRKVQKLAPCVKANIVYKTSAQETNRKTIGASLPLLFPAKPFEQLPEHTKLTLEPPEQRSRIKRLDTKLESKPFLKSINVYLSSA